MFYMAQIEQVTLDDVLTRADIVDVVGQYVTLKRTGAHYKGLCPFHGEKTPSFIVSPDKQIYKCFGCGAGGNVFSFLMNYQQQNFAEVVRDLARQYGIQVRETQVDSQEEQLRVILRKINQEANLFFQSCLQDPEQGAEARNYLVQRGVSESVLQRFQVGYAPESWNALRDHLFKQHFSESQLKDCGLFKASEQSGQLYDFFRHRVMFPILSLNGDVLAFGGRTLNPDLGAKYINSPETPIYVKGRHVYGLNLAKRAIRQKDRVVLAEGYLDVITAHQYGFEETVAALGTALTSDQARQLLRFTESKQVLMAYDADPAGQKAADRGAEVLMELTRDTLLRLNVVQIPEQEDPDTFLHHFGSEAFETVLSNAKDYFLYAFDKTLQGYHPGNPVDQAMASKACVEILMKIKDPVLRDAYVQMLADRLAIDETVLRDQIRQMRKQSVSSYKKREKRREQNRPEPAAEATPEGVEMTSEHLTQRPIKQALKDKCFVSELGLLKLLMDFAAERDQVLLALSELPFEDPHNEVLREYLVSMYTAGVSVQWQELMLTFPETPMQQRLSEMMENPAFQSLDIEKSLADFSRNVKLKCLGLQMKRISADIQQAERNADREACQDLMQEYMELTTSYTRLKQTVE